MITFGFPVDRLCGSAEPNFFKLDTEASVWTGVLPA